MNRADRVWSAAVVVASLGLGLALSASQSAAVSSLSQATTRVDETPPSRELAPPSFPGPVVMKDAGHDAALPGPPRAGQVQPSWPTRVQRTVTPSSAVSDDVPFTPSS